MFDYVFSTNHLFLVLNISPVNFKYSPTLFILTIDFIKHTPMNIQKSPGIEMRGKPGVFDVNIPLDMIPLNMKLKLVEMASKELSSEEEESLRKKYAEILELIDHSQHSEDARSMLTAAQLNLIEQKPLIEKVLKIHEAR